MRGKAHFIARTAAKLVLPAALLIALYVALVSEAGGGLQGGLLAALALALHALVFGPAATQRAAPPFVLRIAAALGIGLLMFAAGAEWQGFAPARFVAPLGAFLVAGAAAALAILALAGRAHELSEGDW